MKLLRHKADKPPRNENAGAGRSTARDEIAAGDAAGVRDHSDNARDDKTGSDKAGNDKAGNDKAGNDKAGNDKAGDNKTGNDTAGKTGGDVGEAKARGARDFDLEAAATTQTPDENWSGSKALPPDAGPKKPSQLRTKGLVAAVKRTFKQYSIDNLGDWAAALTYYGVLSIFPGALVLVSVVGLLGPNGQNTVKDTVSQIAGNKQIEDLVNTVLNQVKGSGTAGFAAIIGILLAFWSASGYVAAFMRASNAVYDVPEGRPIWKTLPIRVGVTAVIGLMLIISAVIVVFTGSLAKVVGQKLGFGGVAVDVWSIAKWPVLIILVSLMFAILYWASPNAKTGGFRWISPGGIFAVVLWLVASGAFAVYLGNFANYSKTYGTLGGVIAFLVWLWISNIAILLGAELDAELERGRAIAAGHDPNDEPFLELRDDRKLKKGSEHGLSSG